jgi:hypothetical protein
VTEAADDAASLFDGAPCGYLTIRPDGTIERVNQTFLAMIGRELDDVVGTPFVGLLTAGGRIFHETHYVPLLQLEGAVHEVAFELRRGAEPPLPVLVNATLERGADGTPTLVRAAVFDARGRRAYERQLLRKHDEEHAIAQILQQSLLTIDEPADPRLDVACHYAAAVDGIEVGGDWYDVFETAPGRYELVAGDVVGKGLGAASAMGRLRSAVRAYAVGGSAPAEILAQLDRFAAIDPPVRYATVVCAEIDLDTGAVCMASAGHPPALRVEPDGAAGYLWEGRSAPLRALAPGRCRQQAAFTLAPGARLVLYTDGLIERRDEPLDEGFARLAAAAGGTVSDLAAQLDTIVRGVRAAGPAQDDACVLIARRRG